MIYLCKGSQAAKLLCGEKNRCDESCRDEIAVQTVDISRKMKVQVGWKC